MFSCKEATDCFFSFVSGGKYCDSCMSYSRVGYCIHFWHKQLKKDTKLKALQTDIIKITYGIVPI